MESVFRTVSLNPARVIGEDKSIGSIEVGKEADLIVFSDVFSLDSVYISGEKVS